MRVCGLDPGSRRLGYGVIDVVSGMPVYVEAGVIDAPASWPLQRRLVELWRGLAEMLDEWKPDVAGVEAGFVKGQQGVLVSGAARGVALLALGCRGIPTEQYAPTSVKKAATGWGRADKDQVARAVMMQLGLKAQPAEDAADALAIAIARSRHIVVLT